MIWEQHGDTALIEAIAECNTFTARLLIDKGANVDIRNNVSLLIGLLLSFRYIYIYIYLS